MICKNTSVSNVLIPWSISLNGDKSSSEIRHHSNVKRQIQLLEEVPYCGLQFVWRLTLGLRTMMFPSMQLAKIKRLLSPSLFLF